MNKKQIRNIRRGNTVTFFTSGDERSVTGQVKSLKPGQSPNDYHTVILNVDGMEYHFGTGGHLGETWTTESGREQWFLGGIK